MNQERMNLLTKTFMMISNLKKKWVAMVYTKIKSLTLTARGSTLVVRI